jgi:hypothetical protein
MKTHVHILIKFMCLFVILLGCESAFALEELDLLWETTYGHTYPETGTSVCQTYDREFAVLGYTNPDNPRGFDIELVLLDSNGNIKWNKTLGGLTNDWGWSIQQTLDGGFIIGGTTTSYGQGPSDGYLIKTSPTGALAWQGTYGGSEEEEIYSVQQTDDTGFILAGSTTSFGNGRNDVYLVKTDVSGKTIWTKTYGGTDKDYASSVQQTLDGGFIVCGTSFSSNAYGRYSDIYLLKTDSNGLLQWQKKLGSTGWDDEGYSARQTSDGGYIVTGCFRANAAGNTRLWNVALIKIDANGNMLWQKEFGGLNRDVGKSVQQTPDGGYIIVGESNSFNIGDKDLYVIKTDQNGTLEWESIYGGDDDDYGRSVQVTPEGGYVIVGTTLSYGAGESDYYILRIGDPMPIANAGRDINAYANIDGIANVHLDGSDSNDPDDDELTYNWSWLIGDKLYEAEGVNPVIDLPIGDYTIELIVNDGRQDSLPDDINVTVVGPTETFLLTYPRPIKRNVGARRVRAILCTPEGTEKDQVDLEKPLIVYPGGIEAIRQNVRKKRIEGVRRTVVVARFDKLRMMSFIPDNGAMELTVIGQLKSGEQFYATDTVMVIERLGFRNFDYGDDDDNEDNDNDDDIIDDDDDDGGGADNGDIDDDDKDDDDGSADNGDIDDDDKDDGKDDGKSDVKDDDQDNDQNDGDKDNADQDDGDQDNTDQDNGDQGNGDQGNGDQGNGDQDEDNGDDWPNGVILI